MRLSRELRVVVLECGLKFRKWTVECEGHRGLHLVRNPRRQVLRYGRAERAVLNQHAAEARHRIAAQRGLVLFAFAEYRNGLVLGIMQRHAGRGDDVAGWGPAVDLG